MPSSRWLGPAAIPFLEGLLPLAKAPFFLPCIEIGGGHPADLHFYLDDACVWVVLLDATAERDQAQRVQQKAYDMTLLQEKGALLNRRLEAANAALRAAQDELETARDVAEQARATVKAGYDTWFFLTRLCLRPRPSPVESASRAA